MNTLLLALALSFAPTAHAQESPERVVMKLEDFLKLYETSRDRPKDPPKPPNAWAVASARYEGVVQFEAGAPKSAIFDATMRIEVLEQKGWVKVPIAPATVALRSATIAGKEAPVVIDSGWYWLVTDKTGATDLKVSFGVAVFTREGASGLAFQLTNSGATTVSLAVPATEDLDFTVADARVKTERTERGMRVVEASVPSTGSFSVTWQRRLPDAVQQDEPRIYAETFTLVGLGDGLLQATSTVNHTILFAGVEQLQVGIPEGMTVLEAKGAGIRDWRVTNDVLTVDLNYSAQGSYPLTLELERMVGDGNLVASAPIPVPLGVERAKGWLGVEARGNLEISSGAVVGATPVDVRSLPAAILGVTTQPVLLGFKYLGGDVQIPLQVSQHADVEVLVTLLDQARATTMWTVDGRRMTSVRYQVRNNRRQFLRLALPEGAELWSASLGGRAVQPAQAADGRVLLPLVRSQSLDGALAAFEVEVVYVEDGNAPDARGAGTFHARLPIADAPTTYVAWRVLSPVEAKIAKGGIASTLRQVDDFSNPIPSHDVRAIPAQSTSMHQSAAEQARGGGLGDGAAPVPVRLPQDGTPLLFEKLLALDEPLEVTLPFRGVK